MFSARAIGKQRVLFSHFACCASKTAKRSSEDLERAKILQSLKLKRQLENSHYFRAKQILLREENGAHLSATHFSVRQFSVEDSIKLLERMKQLKIQPTQDFVINLLAKTLDEDQLHRISALLLHGDRAKPYHVYNHLMRHYSQRKMLPEFIKVFTALDDSQTDSSVFNMLLQTEENRGNKERITEVLEEMKRRGVRPDPRTCTTIVAGYAYHYNFTEAFAAIDYMIKEYNMSISMISLLDLIRKLVEKRNLDEIFTVLNNFRIGYYNNPDLDFDEAFGYVLKLWTKRVGPIKQDVQAVTQLLEWARECGIIDVIAYSKYIKLHLRAKREPPTNTVVEKMKEDNIEPDLQFFSSLINVEIAENNLISVKELMFQVVLKNENLIADAYICDRFSWFVLRHGEFELVEKLIFDKSLKIESDTARLKCASQLLNAYFKSHRYRYTNEPELLMERLIEVGIRPAKNHYFVVISNLIMMGSTERLRSFLLKMQNDSEIQSHVSGIICWVLKEFAHPIYPERRCFIDDTLVFLQYNHDTISVRLGEKFYETIAIKIEFSKSLYILMREQLRLEDIRPFFRWYRHAMSHIAGEREHFLFCLEIIHEMIEYSVRLAPCVLTKLLRVCGKYEGMAIELEQLESLLHKMEYGYEEIHLRLLIDAHLKQRKPQRAIDLFETAQASGISPSLVMCNSAVRALTELDKIEKAVDLLAQLPSLGIQPTVGSFSPIIEKLRALGQFAGASAVEKQMEDILNARIDVLNEKANNVAI